VDFQMSEWPYSQVGDELVAFLKPEDKSTYRLALKLVPLADGSGYGWPDGGVLARQWGDRFSTAEIDAFLDSSSAALSSAAEAQG
jgi:hypothetical protein